MKWPKWFPWKNPARWPHQRDITYMTADQFDELVRTLEEPDDISGFLKHLKGHPK